MSNNNAKNLQDLDRKVKDLLFYKKNVHRNSTRSKILDMLYPDIKLTIRQTESEIDKPYNYTKKIILQMHSDEYLFSDEKKKCNKVYNLSQMGRWFALCIQLDHISFQSLLILSQVYCKIKRDPNNQTSCYMISKFRDAFDKSCDTDESCASAIYTPRNILQSIRILTDRNLIYWANKDFVKISTRIFGFLQKYDGDFTSLVLWQNNIFERCRTDQLKVVMNTPEKKKLFSLIKSTR